MNVHIMCVVLTEGSPASSFRAPFSFVCAAGSSDRSQIQIHRSKLMEWHESIISPTENATLSRWIDVGTRSDRVQ